MLLSLRRLRCAALALLLCACSLLPVCAQDADDTTARLDQILPSLSRGISIGEVAISPDGKRLAWFQRGEIRVAPLNNLDQNQRVTAVSPTQSCSESDFAWSPNSAALVFLSDCADSDGQMDLYLTRLDGAPPRLLTDLHGYVHDPAFSPDGTKVAFLYVEGATRPAGALAAMDAPSGVIGEDDVEIQRVAFSAADAATPALPTFATPANLHVYEFDWSPDSKSLAYIAADPPGENNWWVAKLYTQPIAVGAPTAILSPADVPGPLHGLQIAIPRWSPDGKTIAFIGGLMSDQGVTGGDVWIVSSTGGEPHDLTPGRPASATWIAWYNKWFLNVGEIADGNSQLVLINLANISRGEAGVGTPLFSIPGSLGAGGSEPNFSTTADRSVFVFAASSFERPPEIYSVRTTILSASSSSARTAFSALSGFTGITQLSHLNDGVQPAWGKSVSLTWTNDNFHIQSWLLLPAHYDPAKKYPLLVEVHGGPATAVLSRWGGSADGFSAIAFSALDYFVLMPNPRGSYGQGEAFTQANRKDFGYGDLRDILAGVDAVLTKYPVDPNRIAIAGWSYGGFMTMFAVTQTHRFRAALAGAGISDWLSYYGENSIDQWMIPYFGASVYDDPAVYARSSPITFIKQARTPTLSVVGDRDGECPAPQSFEFWHALRDLHVPSQLVVYPNEGHGFADPAHRRDVLQRAVDWFARYMPPPS
jgi:dipeptidyl aminopeptidase/acylaminoacyl peptidase